MPFSHGDEEKMSKDKRSAHQISQQEARKRTQNRLSQSRHSKSQCIPVSLAFTDGFKGAKVRQQKEALSLELVVPSSFGTSQSDEGNISLSRDTSTASYYDQDVHQALLGENQPQIGFDNFDDFNSLNLLSPQQIVPEAMGYQTPADISGLTPAMPPHVSAPIFSNSYQSTGMPSETLLPPALPLDGELSNGYWAGESMAESQWNISGYSHDLPPCSNPAESINSAIPTSIVTTRPPSARKFRRTSTSISERPIGSPCNLAQTPDSHTSSGSKRNPSKRTNGKSARRPKSTRSESGSGDSCSLHSHCRSCGASNEPSFSKTPVNSPSQTLSCDTSSEHLDVLAQCNKALAQLSQQSDFDGEHEPSRKPTRHRRIPQDGIAADNDVEADGQNAVDKVVIMYIKNRRNGKGV
ncbi:MAG: hypothetical protein Q9167_007785 [Letrouitia subvulpina]